MMILGIAMCFAPFAFFCCLAVKELGFKTATIGAGLVVALTAWFIIAAMLVSQ